MRAQIWGEPTQPYLHILGLLWRVFSFSPQDAFENISRWEVRMWTVEEAEHSLNQLYMA